MEEVDTLSRDVVSSMVANQRTSRTAAATRTNQMRKWRKWAMEMRANGWTVVEPEEPSRAGGGGSDQAS